jgi:hypothetical protein
MTIPKLQNESLVKSRAMVRLNETLDKNLLAYAAAASAAGVGMLALAPVAQAKIVYTPANDLISPRTYVLLDLNHDGIADFLLSNFYTGSSKGIAYAYMFAAGLYTSNLALGNSQNSARALPAKRRVGSSAFTFQPAPLMLAENCDGGNVIQHYGKWQNASTKYLGLQFITSQGINYGWARFDVAETGCQIAPTLTGYAYETIPFKPIPTGKTKGQDVITLEPATLRHLARGAPGLSAWRRRNSFAASH